MSDQIEVTKESITLRESSDYEFEAQGEVVVDGPLGELTILKRYRAAPENDDLMGTNEISEHIKYYHADSNYDNQPYADATHEWTVGDEALASEDRFLEECEAALTGDVRVEYEEALRGTRFGVREALDDAHNILAASDGRIGLTEAQAEAFALREIHDVPRKWAAIALGKDPSSVDNLQRKAREKANTIQRVADAIDAAGA